MPILIKDSCRILDLPRTDLISCMQVAAATCIPHSPALQL